MTYRSGMAINVIGLGYDHPSVRGDLVLTTDAAGYQVGQLCTFDPYGQSLTPDGTVDPQNVPDNSPGAMDYGWLGQYQRPYEHAGALSLVQMGARPYGPSSAGSSRSIRRKAVRPTTTTTSSATPSTPSTSTATAGSAASSPPSPGSPKSSPGSPAPSEQSPLPATSCKATWPEE
jgi:hypothetical protein